MAQTAFKPHSQPEVDHAPPDLKVLPGGANEVFISSPERFLRNVNRFPERAGYFVRGHHGWVPTTWAEYGEAVQQAARALLALGVQRGQVVCILGFNRPEWSIMDMAAMMIGAIPAGIYWTSSVPEVEYILNHSAAPVLLVENNERHERIAEVCARVPSLTHVVCMQGGEGGRAGLMPWGDFLALGEPRFQSMVMERLRSIQPEDTGTLIYTSGTTGPAKAVELSHGSLSWSATSLEVSLGASDTDRIISYLPLAHVAEQMISVHTPALVGFPVYYARSLEELSEHLKEIRPTIFFGVPRVWEKMHAAIEAKLAAAKGIKAVLAHWGTGVARRWHAAVLRGEQPGAWLDFQKRLANAVLLDKVKAAIGLDQCHMLAVGAAPIAPEMLQFFTGLDLVIREVYGQSESCGASTLSVVGATKLGSVGRPIKGAEVRIADDGEIMVRGPHVFKGYMGNPQATADTIVDGWLASGDLGRVDDEGYVYITGRKKDLLITSGGKNISPANIEAALMNTHLVEHAVVCGDGRHYVTALLTLMPDALAAFAKHHHLSGADLYHHPLVLAELQKGVDHVNASSARVAQIRKFSVLMQSFSIESGELTPTMKVKRRVVLDRYKEVIDTMYSETPPEHA